MRLTTNHDDTSFSSIRFLFSLYVTTGVSHLHAFTSTFTLSPSSNVKRHFPSICSHALPFHKHASHRFRFYA